MQVDKIPRNIFAGIMKNVNGRITWVVTGVLFSILWASASTATKIGLRDAQPLVIAQTRFVLASAVMLGIAYLITKQPLPKGRQWKQLMIYGLLNISIYLGLYVVAMQDVTAGIGALAVASNPVLIGLLSVLFLGKKLQPAVIGAIIICMSGVLCASWPLLGNASVGIKGLMLLFISMLSYSAGAVYFSARDWSGLSLLAINGWQTFFGGLFLMPVTLFFYHGPSNHYGTAFWSSVTWLAVPVSFFAVQLWLRLLQWNAVRAGLWLFLCPVSGYLIAAWLLKDHISFYTIAGIALVIAGLLLSRKNSSEVKAE